MNQLPQEPEQDSEPIALPPTHQEQPSKTGLIIAIIIGLLALIALAGILLFRSRAAFGPGTTMDPFFFGSNSAATPSPTIIPEAITDESTILSPVMTPETMADTFISPSPEVTPESEIDESIFATAAITPTPTPTTPIPNYRTAP